MFPVGGKSAMLSLYLRPNGWFTAFNISRLQILRSFWLDYTINNYSVLLSFLASHYQLHIGRNWGIFPMNCSYKWNTEIIVKSELLRNSSNNTKMFISLTFKLIFNHTSRVSVEHIQIELPETPRAQWRFTFIQEKTEKRRANPPLTQGKYFDSKCTQYYRTQRDTTLCISAFLLKLKTLETQQHETKEPVLHPVFINK